MQSKNRHLLNRQCAICNVPAQIIHAICDMVLRITRHIVGNTDKTKIIHNLHHTQPKANGTGTVDAMSIL